MVVVNVIPNNPISVETEDVKTIGVGVVTASISNAEKYVGGYEIDPDRNKIVLPTQNKVLGSDLTINGVKISTVQNLSGGDTVYIGA